MSDSTTISGTVSRIHFSNPDGPWMAGKLDTEDGLVSFAGKVHAEQGDRLELTGRWGNHPKFGRQFEAETGRVSMNESPDALVHLLATSSDFEGLGPARARKVVEAALVLSRDGEFGESLVEYADEIATRAGVSIDIVRNAAEVWSGERERFDALAQLVDQGWSNAQAGRLINRFGFAAPALVRADPYMLIGKLSRFGFRTVDAVALKMGTRKDDEGRIAAGLGFCLDRNADNGHTWTTREDLVREAMEELKPDSLRVEELVHTVLERMIQAGAVMADESPTGREIVADAKLASIELEVFDTLLEGLGHEVEPLDLTGPRAVAILASLNEGQRRAVEGVVLRRTNVVSGAGGVGKTYTMRAVAEIAEENRLRVAFCAPTGKAARKLEHATQREAKTVHRTLVPKIDEKTGEFRFTKHAGSPLEVDLVVVDEVSMMDLRLMRSLLVALPRGCRLLLVGDHNQIPSVGAGAILRDLLSARARHPEAVHVLTEIVRQAGILARNTTAVLDGIVVLEECPAWSFRKSTKGDERGTAAIAATIVDGLVSSELEPFGRVLDLAWDVQVLAPQRKGPLGTYALNVHLQRLRQRRLGNPDPEPTPEDKAPKPLVGDRVIWTVNDYDLDLFNGTQAIVMEFLKGGAMKIRTEDGRDVTIPSGKRGHVEVAYAMTIHKSQGSEWPAVVLVASSAHWFMHDRNLLYTGASRAAEHLTILGDTAGAKHFAQELKSERRQTFGSFVVHGWEPAAWQVRRAPQPMGVAAE